MAKRIKEPINDNKSPEDGIRLNRFLSEAGICSRRQADVLIEKGQVTIDGNKAVTGSKVYEGQEVRYLGKVIRVENKLILIVLNKPRGIVCTANKEEPDNIIDFINYPSRIYPIGRLDKDSEGIILLTNHGQLANQILKARNYHEKEYMVTVNKGITDTFIEQMSAGVPILETITRKCQVTREGKSSFRIILTQGLNRQIRRMCEYLGYQVLVLKRVRIMNIHLGKLKPGQFRNVTDRELQELNRLLANKNQMDKSEEKNHGHKNQKNKGTDRGSKSGR